MWGTTWLDHLQLILPLGILLLLLVRSLLAVRPPLSEDAMILLWPPGEDPHPASGASRVFSVASSGPLTPSSSTGQPGPVGHREQTHFIEPSGHSPEARYAELPICKEPLTFPQRPAHVEDLEHRDPLELTRRTRFASESATPRPFADDAPTIRIAMHPGSPIEFLPGRLETLEGIPGHQEFRFQRVVGGPPPEVTLGRAPGPAYRHFQLSAPTVSRIHARIRFENGRWVITHLPEASPLYVRGQLITDPHVLLDGDEVQIGEVLLRYRDGRP